MMSMNKIGGGVMHDTSTDLFVIIRCGLFSGLDTPYYRPGGGQEGSRDENFDGVARDEG